MELDNMYRIDRENLDCLEDMVGRNMNIKGASSEALEGNDEHVIRQWRKDTYCYSGRKLF